MSVTFLHEDNQARWVGVRPAHKGEQVDGYAVAQAALTVLYTVPAGQVLLIDWVSFAGVWSAGGGIQGWIGIYTAVPAVDHIFYFAHANIASGAFADSGNFWPPYEVPAQYSVRVYSAAAAMSAFGSFKGIVV